MNNYTRTYIGFSIISNRYKTAVMMGAPTNVSDSASVASEMSKTAIKHHNLPVQVLLCCLNRT